jgi:hypothetical protein
MNYVTKKCSATHIKKVNHANQYEREALMYFLFLLKVDRLVSRTHDVSYGAVVASRGVMGVRKIRKILSAALAYFLWFHYAIAVVEMKTVQVQLQVFR